MNQRATPYCFVVFLFAFVLIGCHSPLAVVDPATLPDEPVTMNLWPGEAPGQATYEGELPATSRRNGGALVFVHVPTLEIFHAKGENRTGAAVVICPGGGYGVLADGHEGTAIAKWLNDNGITAIILRYRMHPYRHPIPMMDVQRAMQSVRANASAWAIDADRIGIIGFSAGGHLASTAATHFADADPMSDDPVQRVSSRPNFAVLLYPVISMRQGVTHGGSRNNLLGPAPDEALVTRMSNDEQVTDQTPPTLLVHSRDDKVVLIANSERFLTAMKQHHVPGKLIEFETGGHGYGLGRGPDHETIAWPALCMHWLGEIGMIKPMKSSHD